MEDIVKIVFIVLVLVAITVLIIFGVRALSNAVTPVNLVTPKEGVTCATMVTGDGAAISCWKD